MNVTLITFINSQKNGCESLIHSLINLLEMNMFFFMYYQGSETSSGGGGGSSSSTTRSSSRRTSEEPHIGKYRLLKTIGKGNFAKVKLAKHIPTGKEVNPIVFMFVMFLANHSI